MTGSDLKAIREAYGCTQAEFGRLLGFDGDPKSVARRVRLYESGTSTISGPLLRLLELMAKVRLV